MTKAIIAFIIFINKNHKFLFLCGITALFSAFMMSIVFMIVVIQLPPETPIFIYIAGNTAKLEVIKLIGWGMSGLIATLSVIGLLQRAAALDNQNKMIEKGHIQERFKVATEHLGNERDTVRITAFYEFYHLAEIEPVWQKSIFNILCAHLRQTTKHKKYTPKESFSHTKMTKEIKPTEEVQILLSILFTRRNNDDTIFDELIANLEGANLQGADLREAPLQGANLQGTNLQDADLEEAFLQEAFLQETNLQGVDLQRANLQGANLFNAMINKETTMPDNWENMVKKYEDGETGVRFVD